MYYFVLCSNQMNIKLFLSLTNLFQFHFSKKKHICFLYRNQILMSKSIIWALKYSYFSMEVNKKCLGSFLGIAICASSALFISVSNVIVKHLSHMDPFLFSCIRYGTIAMMASPVTMSKGKEMWKYQVSL